MTSPKKTLFDTVKEAYSELLRAKGLLDDIIGSLQTCLTAEGGSNLTESIGIYVKQMPKFKFLTSQADQLKCNLRMVCSGEIGILEALSAAEEYSIMITEALNCFNADVIYPDECVNSKNDCANDGCCGNCADHCDHECECTPHDDECDCKYDIESVDEDDPSDYFDNDYEELAVCISGTKEAVLKAVKRIFK